MKSLFRPHLYASALLVFATAAAIQAQDWYWIGAVSENWSDTGNWNSAADGTGSAPTDIALDFSGKNIMLQGNGAYQPANQDIADLSIENLQFNDTTVSFDLNGESIALKQIQNPNEPSATAVVRIYAPLVLKKCNDWESWSVRGRLQLEVWGPVSETGGSRSFSCNDGGNVHFYGPVTITGGMHHNQATAHYYGMQTVGALPEVFDEDYFSTGYGSMHFHLPPGTDYCVYHFDENVGARSTDNLCFMGQNGVEIILDGPISENQASKNFEFREAGILFLNGANTFSGKFKPTSGMTVLGGSLVPGGQINSNAGTLDLYGHDILGRDLTFENGLGVKNNGSIVNSDEEHEATLDGDITKLASNRSVAQFGGRGDIRLEGDITDTTSDRLFQKLGTGRLTFAGSSVNPNDFSIRNGTLALDYTVDNGNKIADTANLSLVGCLDLIGNADADSTEIINALNLGENAVKIRPEGKGGHAAALRVSTLKLANQGTLNIAPSSNGSVGILTPENSALGILGARAIYGGSSFARAAAEADVDGYTLVEPLPDAAYTSGFDAGSNAEIVDLVANTTLEATESVGAIRFASDSASKLTLNANLQILGEKQDSNGHNGAILVTSARGTEETVIEGGLIGQNFVNGSLYIHQENAAAPLVIGSRLFNFSSGNGIVKSGPGELRLENPENAFADTYLLDGTLTVTSITNRNSNSAAGQCGSMTIGSATFRYVGDGGESDVTIKSRGASVFDASGTGPLVLTSAQGIQYINETGRDSVITFTGSGEGELQGPVDIDYGQVRKQGTGKWTLSCETNKLFWGAVVEQGELCVTGFFGRDITVRDGATLSGSPTIQRNLELESGATLLVDPAANPMAVGYDVSIAEGANLVLTERLPFDEPVTVLTYGGKFTGSFTTERPEEYRVSYDDGSVVVTRRSVAMFIIVR